jgi:arginase
MVFYRRLSKFINGAPVHISFDVDAVDPSYISCTGTPVPKGLEMYATKFILDKLLKHENVVGMDIVEMNLDINAESNKESVHNLQYLLPSIFSQT